MSNLLRDLAAGAATGYVANRVMDLSTAWFYERQSEASKRREERIAPGGAPLLGGRKMAAWLGRDVTDDQAAAIGMFMHRLLGIFYGLVVMMLVRSGMRPLTAGMLTGAAAFILVDEGVNSIAITPPPHAYLPESHLRGLFGHLVFGVTAGLLLTLTRHRTSPTPKATP